MYEAKANISRQIQSDFSAFSLLDKHLRNTFCTFVVKEIQVKSTKDWRRLSKKNSNEDLVVVCVSLAGRQKWADGSDYGRASVRLSCGGSCGESYPGKVCLWRRQTFSAQIGVCWKSWWNRQWHLYSWLLRRHLEGRRLLKNNLFNR